MADPDYWKRKQENQRALAEFRRGQAAGVAEHRKTMTAAKQAAALETAKGVQEHRKVIAPSKQEAMAQGKKYGRFGATPKAGASPSRAKPKGTSSLVNPNRDRRDARSDAAKGVGKGMVGQSASLANPNAGRAGLKLWDPATGRNGRDNQGRALTGDAAAKLAAAKLEYNELLKEGPPDAKTQGRLEKLLEQADGILGETKQEKRAAEKEREVVEKQRQEVAKNERPMQSVTTFPQVDLMGGVERTGRRADERRMEREEGNVRGREGDPRTMEREGGNVRGREGDPRTMEREEGNVRGREGDPRTMEREEGNVRGREGDPRTMEREEGNVRGREGDPREMRPEEGNVRGREGDPRTLVQEDGNARTRTDQMALGGVGAEVLAAVRDSVAQDSGRQILNDVMSGVRSRLVPMRRADTLLASAFTAAMRGNLWRGFTVS